VKYPQFFDGMVSNTELGNLGVAQQKSLGIG
jgi:hypothetical protein